MMNSPASPVKLDVHEDFLAGLAPVSPPHRIDEASERPTCPAAKGLLPPSPPHPVAFEGAHRAPWFYVHVHMESLGDASAKAVLEAPRRSALRTCVFFLA
jgi:hypothetical protein